MKQEKQYHFEFCILLLFALLLRGVFAAYREGFASDIACFHAWAVEAFENGYSTFYTSGQFADYPPGYIIVLSGIGALFQLLHITDMIPWGVFLLKFPAILCDLLAAATVYYLVSKKRTGIMPSLLGAAYLFNPAVIQNSAIWGQVDSVFLLAVVWMCILLMQKKTIFAIFVYAVGILLKPQTVVFTPLLIFGVLENSFRADSIIRALIQNLIGGLAAIGMMLLICYPFGIGNTIAVLTRTMGSYPYISVNAYNFWSMLGLNWQPQDLLFLGFISYKTIGTIVILILCPVSAWIFYKRRRCSDRYWVTGTFIIFTFFLFSVRMHERYLFPAMLLLLLAYSENNISGFLWDYCIVSAVQFLNCWHILTFYTSGSYNSHSAAVILISMFTLLEWICFLWHVFFSPERKLSPRCSGVHNSQSQTVPPAPHCSANRRDILIIAAITLLYGCFAFGNLGATEIPQSEYHVKQDENVLFYFPENESVSSLSCYLGHDREVKFSLWEWDYSNENWNQIQDLQIRNVFSWEKITFDREVSGTICMIMLEEDHDIREFVFQNSQGDIVIPQNASSYGSLFDENQLLPEDIGYLNSCYFDEIYYTRTAYEMRNGLETYEWTHPPLGKVLITFSTLLFGYTPFGFRFIGTLLGVLMVPIMYLFGWNICKNRTTAAFIAFIFAFDFMHFTQTRITTIDVYITFFVILMYYFMEKYISTNYNKQSLKSTWLPLGACGICFGLGIASKWTGFYSGAGLAVIFFAAQIRYMLESRSLSVSENKENYWHSPLWKDYRKKLILTCFFCIAFFILLPACIYALSYMPFRSSNPDEGLISRLLNNQKSMFHYHSQITDDHPYASPWYKWPTMIRPILYYSQSYDGNIKSAISAFGNPMVWWMGIPAFLYTLLKWLREKDRTAAFLLVGVLSAYLPWILVSRCTFIYHFFPCVPFITLMIGYSLQDILNAYPAKIRNNVFIAYALGVFFLFILFYPVISGTKTSAQYIQILLRWLDTWVLAC